MEIPAAVMDLDIAHAVLGEAPGHQALLAEGVAGVTPADAVAVEGRLGFALDVHDLRNLALHPEGQLEGLDDAIELVIDSRSFTKLAVHFLDEVELLALLAGGQLTVVEVRQRAAALSADRGSLEAGRKEGATVVLGSAETVGRVDRDEAGQIVVFSSEPVEHPGAHRGAHEIDAAGVGENRRLRVGRVGGVHAVENAEVIGVF